MALIPVNLHPSRREQRIFTFLILPGLLALAGWIGMHHSGSLLVAAIPWALGFGVILAGLLFPPIMRVFLLGWTYATYPIGLAVSFFLLAAIYYFVLTPLSLVARLLRRDPLERKVDPGAVTYWTLYRWNHDIDRYFKQF